MMGVLSALEPLVLRAIFDALAGKPRIVVSGIVMMVLLLGGREVLSAVSNWLTGARLRVHHSLLDAAISACTFCRSASTTPRA